MKDSKTPNIPLTDSDKEDICRMCKNGSTAYEIAEYIGCSIDTVYRYIRKFGIVVRKVWTEEETGKLTCLYNDGAKLSEIANSLGRSKSCIMHRLMYLRRLGHDIKYRRR